MFLLPKSSLGEHKVPMSQFYPSQTEILEDRTNISEHVSWEALFKGVRGRFGLKDVDPTGFVSVEITKPDMIPVTNTI